MFWSCESLFVCLLQCVYKSCLSFPKKLKSHEALHSDTSGFNAAFTYAMEFTRFLLCNLEWKCPTFNCLTDLQRLNESVLYYILELKALLGVLKQLDHSWWIDDEGTRQECRKVGSMNCNFSVTFVKYSNQSSIKPSLIDCNCEQVPPVFTFKVAFCEGSLNYKRFLGRLPTHLITHNLPSQNSKPIF